MKQLYEYSLDFSQTLAYLKKNLEGTSVLSTATFNYVPFQEGKFYTFFRKEATPQQLHGFLYGGLAGGILEEAVDIVFKEVQNQPELFCIFDDIDETYESTYKEPLFLKVGAHYQEEMYYIISPQEISKDLLAECFDASDAIWHSLCVVSKTSIFIREDRSITEVEIIRFVQEARLILIQAYDDEGYVFWKKTVS